MYRPKPIDVAGVEIPRHLHDLIETLARNNHDLWAEQRLREGWVRDAERDDERKTHPLLVPYEDLPESEKEIDHKMAVGVLKARIGTPRGRSTPDKPRSVRSLRGCH